MASHGVLHIDAHAVKYLAAFSKCPFYSGFSILYFVVRKNVGWHIMISQCCCRIYRNILMLELVLLFVYPFMLRAHGIVALIYYLSSNYIVAFSNKDIFTIRPSTVKCRHFFIPTYPFYWPLEYGSNMVCFYTCVWLYIWVVHIQNA